MWIVQALERRGDDGQPTGLYHLTANSDEGGGFHVGCDHDHVSIEEAAACPIAKRALGTVTGFPVDED